MPYVDGFVIAVPNANRQAFIDHASAFDPLFLEYGATRVLECWGDDVPRGQLTDFFRACRRARTNPWCSHGSNGRTRPPATRA